MIFADVTSTLSKSDSKGQNSAPTSDIQILYNGFRVIVPSDFLFCNKRHNSLRVLRWDGNGFILVTKSLSDEMKKTKAKYVT